MKHFKILMLLPLLFFGRIVNAQFNTASFQKNIASVEVKPFDENQFQGTFLTYHIEGKVKKTKKPKKKESEEVNDDIISENKVSENMIIEHTESKALPKEVRKKLEPISEQNYEYIERQYIYMPLDQMIITSNFGKRFHPIDRKTKFHSGVDLKANNDYVYSVLDGVVMDVGYTSDAGNYIKILHSANYETIYLHLDKIFFTIDQKVNAGDIIAISGDTGKSTAPHLHFAVKENGNYIDPIEFLNDLIATNNAISDYESTNN